MRSEGGTERRFDACPWDRPGPPRPPTSEDACRCHPGGSYRDIKDNPTTRLELIQCLIECEEDRRADRGADRAPDEVGPAARGVSSHPEDSHDEANGRGEREQT